MMMSPYYASQTPTRITATWLRLFWCALILVACCEAARAQTVNNLTGNETPGALKAGSPAGSYGLSDIESLNMYNGSLSAKIPLMKVGGRGGASYLMTQQLPQNKKSFDHHLIDYYSGIGPNTHRLTWESVAGVLADRDYYKVGYGPGVVHGRNAGKDYSNCGGDAGNYYHETFTFIEFTGPDGTQYPLYDEMGNNDYNGVGRPCTEGARYRGNVFSSRDGSGMTFVSDYAIGDKVSPELNNNWDDIFLPDGYLLMPDGTRYRVERGLVRWIRDRNGNKLSFDYSGGRVQQVTDSLGRVITFQYAFNDVAPYGLCDRITYKGFGGDQRIIRISSVGEGGLVYGGVPDLFQLSSAKVWLPDGVRSYNVYYNSTGEIRRIELPAGGAVEYDYAAGVVGTDPSGQIGQSEYMVNSTPYQDGEGTPPQLPKLFFYRRLIERRVYPSGGSGSGYEGRTTYSRPETGSCTMYLESISACTFGGYDYVQEDSYDTVANGGQVLSSVRHYFNGRPAADMYAELFFFRGYPDSTKGKETLTEWLSGGVPARSVANTWQLRYHGPVITATVTTLSDVTPNLVSKRELVYDQYNNTTDVYEYDYGQGGPGTLIRRTHTDYKQDVSYIDAVTGAYLRRLPVREWVSTDAAGADGDKASLTVYGYDEFPLTDYSDVFGHDAAYGPNLAVRGNGTTITSYANAATSADPVTASMHYDITGNVVKAVDAIGHETLFDFADDFGSPDGEARNNTIPPELARQSQTAHVYAFPKSVTDAAGHISYTQYDYYLGQPVDGEDINGTHTLLHYDDPLDRMTQSVRAFGAAEQSQTTITYNDAGRAITETADLNAYNDNILKSETIYDGLGRTVKLRKYEDSAQYILTEQKYDAMGRVSAMSNPYRPTLGESTVWSKTAYDALGRVTSMTTPDGAAVYTLYDGPRTLVTDQAKRQRVSKMDALGRLTEVWEVRSEDTALGTEHVTFPVPQSGPVPEVSDGYRTAYSYDVLGNLRTVTQGAQSRTFIYDSLSRLTSATNPEGGTVEYRYDANGNLTLKIDPRTRAGSATLSTCSITYMGNHVATCHEYDVLNRIKSRSYNDGTPNITYTYDDPAVAHSLGRLTSVASSVSTYSYTAYDTVGRVTASSQTTGGVTYSMPEYKYDLAGNLASEKYPSGRVVESQYDAAGRVTGVKNQAMGFYYTGAAPTDATNRIQYAAHGVASAMRMGNGLWVHATFNSRLQPTQIGLGTSGSDSSVLRLDYAYGATDNNGNLRTQTIMVPGTTSPFVQSYGYDALNRLQTAEETVGVTSNWKQVYAYDRYGNRNFGAGTTYPNYSQTSVDATTNLPIDPVGNPGFDPENNRVKSSIAGQGNYMYDKAGNMIRVPVTSQTYHEFLYDAENRQVSADGGTAAGGTDYSYDGDGRRVKKMSGVVTVVFVYDISGKMVAEYSNAAPVGNGTRYVTSDILGTPRVVTGSDSQAKERHDYMPFGEEIAAGYNSRANVQGYGVDTLRQKFGAKERDGESGLDYFSARYYESRRGRFLSVDVAAPDPVDPQSLNKYQYCYNNPGRYQDPDGRYGSDIHYDLTRILALAAGFSESQANLVAKDTQASDVDPEKTPDSTKDLVPFGKAVDKRALWHFTTWTRRVEMWNIFERYAGNEGSSEATFMRLGEYLHAVEDSYSHAGWGPRTGQVFSAVWNEHGDVDLKDPHRVDETDYNPSKADRMAKNVFDALLAAKKTMNMQGRAPIAWDKISYLIHRYNSMKPGQERAKLLYDMYFLVTDRADNSWWKRDYGCLSADRRSPGR